MVSGFDRVTVRLLIVLVAATVVCQIVADRQALAYDSFNYAFCSRALYETARAVDFAPGFAHGREQLAAVWHGMFGPNRPPFYAPGTLLLALLHYPWSVSAALLANSVLLLLVLMGSLRRLLAHASLAPPVRQAAQGAALATLALSPVFWDAATSFMGELAVMSAVAWMLLGALQVLRLGRVRDHLSFGAAIAWGFLTKPIFIFFALPVCAVAFGVMLVRIVRAVRSRSALPSRAAGLVIAAMVPLITLLPSYDNLCVVIAELHLVNEVLKIYQRSTGLMSDAIFLGTIITETFPPIALALIAIPWVAAIRDRAGRIAWLALIVLLGYVVLRVNQRAARLFPGLLVVYPLLTALGVGQLPARFGLLIARMTVLTACTLVAAGLLDLRGVERIGACTSIVRPVEDASGAAVGVAFDAGGPLIVRRGDEYGRYHVAEIMNVIRARGGASRVLVAFALLRLNWTTFQSYPLAVGDASAEGIQFQSNDFRLGAFGSEGGLTPELLTAPFVIVKSGAATVLRREVGMYSILINAALMNGNSPLAAGLELVGSWPLEDGERIALFRRARAPSAAELLGIWDVVLKEDPDNLWNIRYVRQVLQAAAELGRPAVTEATHQWVAALGDPRDAAALQQKHPYWNVENPLHAEWVRAYQAAVAALNTAAGERASRPAPAASASRAAASRDR